MFWGDCYGPFHQQLPEIILRHFTATIAQVIPKSLTQYLKLQDHFLHGLEYFGDKTVRFDVQIDTYVSVSLKRMARYPAKTMFLAEDKGVVVKHDIAED
ncbi:hypothetical protein GcC1_196027 [Golovinomyces cichoracearum]|uniref:Uncharacterized protein n=1 Tax=Golovinomyces cichoracearum TaxID=62708 RepID=A0A420HGB0_9PEZI|nr:hypothetical protein GcC1_196027 [Golovinomyces cichoracearum]